MSKLIDIYEKETTVEYKNEKYSVRDNGAVMRHSMVTGKKRKLDEIWTFGKVDKGKGYLLFSSEAVHRIVAYAFLGLPPNKSYVVDHKDTNKRNNRPENLRWVTRLENILLNDITRHKIELLCGMSIKDVLSDISILQSMKLPQNFDWMKTVTKEEAAKSLDRWNKWCKEVEGLRLTDDARLAYLRHRMSSQRNNKIESYPFEPAGVNPTLSVYANNLKIGEVFYSRTYKSEKIEYKILDFYYNDKMKTLSVATTSKGGVKNLFLTTITRKNDEFVYETRSFFDPNGIDKYMTLAKGLEWTGGDVFDDFC